MLETVPVPLQIDQGHDRIFTGHADSWRSEEHTSELQSREKLVCRLLLEKKKPNNSLMYKYFDVLFSDALHDIHSFPTRRSSDLIFRTECDFMRVSSMRAVNRASTCTG